MVLIFAERITNRLDYICTQIFRNVLGFDFRLTESREEARTFGGAVISYSSGACERGLRIVPCGLLAEQTVEPHQPVVTDWQSMPIFFQTEGGDLPFDIFAASFYLITRYEEYLSEDLDKHGRFKAENSIAYKNGFLERPIVDEWAVALRDLLKSRFGVVPENAPTFRFIPTIDVDHAFAFRHKGCVVNGYKMAKALLSRDFACAARCIKVLLRLEDDPFFNFEALRLLHASVGPEATIFFHCGGRGKFDKRTFFPSLRYFLAKRKLSETMRVGLHPSYRSAGSPSLFALEKWVMERSVKSRVSQIRYHYLKFTVPDSYAFLSENGFTDDWSMIYSNDPGFRAGTSFPFRFYNLKNEQTTGLTIHPTAVMDKTLQSNKGLSANEAYGFILRLSERVRAVNGQFVTLFHNDHLTDAFDEWRGWLEIYERVIRHFLPTK